MSGLRILQVEPGSIAEELGIQPGDRLLEINGRRVKDQLDYRFHEGDGFIRLLIQHGEELIEYEIEKYPEDILGLVLPELRLRRCANKCVFCFIDQLPAGLRKTLYVKDGDYRFSFTDGNFVTLSNVSQQDLERIVEYRLYPLYVSVHTVEPDLRRRMLGLKKDDQILEKLAYLAGHGVEIHAQIVLCPGWNDGEHLEITLRELHALTEGVLSISIVPVGLTSHRERLTPLQAVTRKDCLQLFKRAAEWDRIYRNRRGERLVYLADEFFLMTGRRIPGRHYYHGFYQLENGVGLTRQLLDRFYRQRRSFPTQVRKKRKVSIATGYLIYPLFKTKIVDSLNSIDNLSVQIFPVKNRLLGESVTVSGLLSGGDFYEGLKNKELGDELFITDRCINYEGYFLDNWEPDDLAEALGVKVTLTDNFRPILFTGEE